MTSPLAAEIVATVIDPLTTLDLTRNLSPTRRNGLAAAHRVIREFAQKHAAPSEPGGSPA